MSERKKQKPEEKVKIVKRYLAGEVSMSEAVTEAGVNWKTLQKWVMQYEAEGAAAFLPGRREHIYSPELKLQAVQEYLSGKGSQAELSKKYGLRDRRQLQNWLKVYNAHGDFNSTKFWHCKVNMKKLGPEISQYRYATSRNSRLRFLDSLSPAHCAGVRLFKAE